jgi:hypothetical protein
MVIGDRFQAKSFWQNLGATLKINGPVVSNIPLINQAFVKQLFDITVTNADGNLIVNTASGIWTVTGSGGTVFDFGANVNQFSYFYNKGGTFDYSPITPGDAVSLIPFKNDLGGVVNIGDPLAMTHGKFHINSTGIPYTNNAAYYQLGASATQGSLTSVFSTPSAISALSSDTQGAVFNIQFGTFQVYGNGINFADSASFILNNCTLALGSTGIVGAPPAPPSGPSPIGPGGSTSGGTGGNNVPGTTGAIRTNSFISMESGIIHSFVDGANAKAGFISSLSEIDFTGIGDLGDIVDTVFFTFDPFTQATQPVYMVIVTCDNANIHGANNSNVQWQPPTGYISSPTDFTLPVHTWFLKKT